MCSTYNLKTSPLVRSFAYSKNRNCFTQSLFVLLRKRKDLKPFVSSTQKKMPLPNVYFRAQRYAYFFSNAIKSNPTSTNNVVVFIQLRIISEPYICTSEINQFFILLNYYSKMEKIIIAQFSINPKQVDTFLAIASELVENTRKEQGCLFYTHYQSVENPCDFIFYERYKDQSDIDFHLTSPHYNKAIEQINKLLSKEPVVKII